MRISVLTMCPEMFGDFRHSPVISRSEAAGRLTLDIIDFRNYTEGSFRKIDDSPYGGGRGMIIRCQPVIDAIEDIRTENSRIVILSPAGRPYSQKTARRFFSVDHLILVCGHFEGFDQRIYSYADEVVSIGDYILTGGELPAKVVMDSVIRLLDGVLRKESTQRESFEEGLLEYPQYTKPLIVEGEPVPEALLTGDHQKTEAWRLGQSLIRTLRRRPDLLRRRGLSERERHLLETEELTDEERQLLQTIREADR